MDSSNKSIPSIRFKGYEKDWEIKKLSEVNTFFSDGNYGNDYPRTSDLTDKLKGVPFLRGSNIVNGKLTEINANYITKEKHIQLVSGHLYYDDIVIAVRGSLGVLGYVDYQNVGWNINSQLAIIRTDKKQLSGSYLLQFLLSPKGQFSIISKISGSALKQLPISQVKELSIPITVLKEQTQIGNFFKTLDEQINLQEQKHQKLINLKKAMLEKMFPKEGADTPEIRFKGFTVKWEEKKLGEFVTFFNGLTYSPNDIRDSRHTLVLRSSNVKNNSIVLNDNVFVDNRAVNSENVLIGDIIVVVRNGSRNLIGKHAKIKFDMKNTVIGAFMTGLRYQDPNFLNALLDSNKFISEIEKNLGATINQITLGAFKEMQFKIPSEKEQQKIGDYFENLDNLIQQAQLQLEKHKNIKQALLQKMFV